MNSVNGSTLNIRLTTDIKEKLKNLADSRGIGVSALAREILEDYFSKDEQDAQKSILLNRDIIKHIQYLHYMADNDTTPDDYQSNYLIRRELVTLWKLSSRIIPQSGLENLPDKSPES